MTLAEWEELVRSIVIGLAEERTTWTGDDVWEALEDYVMPEGLSPKRLGTVLGAMQREGLILTTNRRVKSRRKERHSGDIRVWTSPGAAWAVPDSLPAMRALRELVEAYADAHDLDLIEATARLVKEGLARD